MSSSPNGSTWPADVVRSPSTPAAVTSNWPSIASLTLGVFSLVMAEFLPISLLTAMASDLRIRDGAAGQAVTATALVGAVAAPSLPLLTKRLDRRVVMLAFTAVLLLSSVIAAKANSLAMLLAARVMLGVALDGFWSMSAALALRLVPAHQLARAMSFLLSGVSVATVCAGIATMLGTMLTLRYRSEQRVAGV